MTLVVAYIVMASVAIVYIVRALAGSKFFCAQRAHTPSRAIVASVPRECPARVYFFKKKQGLGVLVAALRRVAAVLRQDLLAAADCDFLKKLKQITE